MRRDLFHYRALRWRTVLGLGYLRAPLLRRAARLAVAPAIAVAPAACSAPYSTLEPAGPVAGSLAQLWWAMLIGATILFSLVMALFMLVALRPAWAARVSPMGWIVWGGLALPGVVLRPLVVWALIKGEGVLPLPYRDVETIEATGFQFGWTFRYPDRGGVETTDVLHLSAGAPVDIAIRSRDVIHSFWVPRLAAKLDAIPGHVNVQRLVADRLGILHGVCAEFCGLEHTRMRFEVQVHTPEDYADLLTGLGVEDGR